MVDGSSSSLKSSKLIPCTVWPTADLKQETLNPKRHHNHNGKVYKTWCSNNNMLLFVSVWNSSNIKTHQGKEEISGLMKDQQIRYSMALNLSGSIIASKWILVNIWQLDINYKQVLRASRLKLEINPSGKKPWWVVFLTLNAAENSLRQERNHAEWFFLL